MNDDEKTSTVYHIENLEQLHDWMNKDAKVVSSMIQELRKNNDILTHDYNIVEDKHDHLFDLYQTLLSKNDNQDKSVSIKSVHRENISFVQTSRNQKSFTFKKLSNSLIFIDEKDSLINDWLSIMRNKLEENADWY